MIPESKGMIYLGEQRGCTQTEWHRSHHTLNYGTYSLEHRNPFGDLIFLNDETLKEGCTEKYSINQNVSVLVLPVVGACRCKDKSSIDRTVDAGQLVIFPAGTNTEFEITNPYENELINYLLIGFTSGNYSVDSKSINEFDLDNNKDKLIPLVFNSENDSPGISVYIGKFGGRREGLFPIRNAARGVFVFILEGAFEVQNRLLQIRDGLAIWDANEIEFEALSNDAIILLIENR